MVANIKKGDILNQEMNRINIYFIQIIILLLFFLTGCSSSSGNNNIQRKEFIINNTPKLLEVLENNKSDFTIHLKTGIYNIKNIDFNDRRNIEIIGVYAEDCIIYGNFDLDECNNIKFNNLNIRYRGIGNNKFIMRIRKSKNITIDNVMMENSKSNTIEIIESDVYIRKLTLLNSNKNGIVGINQSVVTLENSTIANCHTYGVASVESIIVMKTSLVKDNIKGNLVGEKSSQIFLRESTVQESINGFGIRIRYSKLNMDNSNSLNNHTDGIYSLIGAECLITDSYISFNGKNGINSEDMILQVEDTVFENNSQNGIRLKNTTAIFREILSIGSTEGNGLFAYKSDVNIVNSIFHLNNKNGIALINCISNIIAVLCSNSDETSGLYMDNSEVIIKKSTFNHNKTDGIKILEKSKVTIHSSNMMKNNSDGIEINNSDLSLIGSKTKYNTDYGINTNESLIKLNDIEIEENGKGEINNNNSELIYE